MSGVSASHHAALVRIFFLLFGCFAVGWGAAVLPLFWQQAAIGRVANRIIDGYPFRSEVLARLLPALNAIEGSRYPRPSALRSAAIVRLRVVEDAISAGEQPLIDLGLEELDRSVRRSLACSPADSFLWLVLFWVENARNGFKPQNLALLEMSYRLSSNEAWIGLKRVPVMVPLLEYLPANLKAAVIAEFVGLIGSGYYLQMAALFPKLSPGTSTLVLDRMKSVSLRYREAFAREVYRRGYHRIQVPGVAPVDPRPWH